jgi:hypothetical protein
VNHFIGPLVLITEIIFGVLQSLAEVYPEARLRTKGQAQHEDFLIRDYLKQKGDP